MSPLENCHPLASPGWTVFTPNFHFDLKLKIVCFATGETGLTCGVCNKTFITMELLQHHARVHQLEDLSNICKGRLPPAPQSSVLHSHWSRASECCYASVSYAIKNPTSGFLLAPLWFFMA